MGAPVLCRALNLVVTNTADSGPGSFREAIQKANTNPGPHDIRFNIGSGAQTISPLTLLPWILEPVTINGTTQPGYAGHPIVELTGRALNGAGDGLFITGGHSKVSGLVINSFRSGAGIILVDGGSNVIEGCFIGTDISGKVGQANGDGIGVGSDQNLIGGTTLLARNVISGNDLAGLSIQGQGNVVQGNLIGTDATGGASLGNGRFGVLLGTGSQQTIGGLEAGAKNVISGNGEAGLQLLYCAESLIQGNFVGTDYTGFRALPNRQAGVSILFGRMNIIGGTGPNGA